MYLPQRSRRPSATDAMSAATRRRGTRSREPARSNRISSVARSARTPDLEKLFSTDDEVLLPSKFHDLAVVTPHSAYSRPGETTKRRASIAHRHVGYRRLEFVGLAKSQGFERFEARGDPRGRGPDIDTTIASTMPANGSHCWSVNTHLAIQTPTAMATTPSATPKTPISLTAIDCAAGIDRR